MIFIQSVYNCEIARHKKSTTFHFFTPFDQLDRFILTILEINIQNTSEKNPFLPSKLTA